MPTQGRSPAASSTACGRTPRTSAPRAELDGIEDILETAATAPTGRPVVYEANHDLHEVMHEIAEASIPE